MIRKLHKKSELAFSLVWIGIYIVLMSAADGISTAIGVEKAVSAPICLILTLFLCLWIRANGLEERYGLCRFKGKAGDFLFFLPLLPIVCVNFVFGVRMTLTPLETVLSIADMLCVGVTEEIIFRGFLFKSLCGGSIKTAVAVSSITFGVGHIVNLLNGAELVPTLLQIVYASAAGFLFTVIVLRGGSLLPCMAAHSLLNSFSVIGGEGSESGEAATAVFLTLWSLGYAVWILRRTRGKQP